MLYLDPLHIIYSEKRGAQINHLSFVDDAIIFPSGRKASLNLIMKILVQYEEVSGQIINKTKIHFMILSNAFKPTVNRIKRITNFMQKKALLSI